ncbi:hypothetical protein SDC9_103811 [bioreactor metagenome]|uniref:Uncharacterized protein n=1 Tax=bioreactor metagenome TaxID=1076179 RepID=A0A645B5I3_9ZZZZ
MTAKSISHLFVWVLGAATGKKDDKLITPKASDDRLLGEKRLHKRGKVLDDLVAQLMTIGIVDLLEQVDVNKEECPAHIMLFSEMLGYQLLKGESVEELAQRITLGTLEELQLRLFQFMNILDGNIGDADPSKRGDTQGETDIAISFLKMRGMLHPCFYGQFFFP